ncbi:Sulfur carrier protein ThiS [Phycisphaerae bacterium RAS1]|nr:Sulfur carrier protein ThiS [Phycisphaerae bacterium RAS1]
MRLMVNGEEKTLQDVRTVADLLAQFDLPPQRVAVELNQNLVRRANFEQQALSEGDQLEIVTFVGGG